MTADARLNSQLFSSSTVALSCDYGGVWTMELTLFYSMYLHSKLLNINYLQN